MDEQTIRLLNEVAQNTEMAKHTAQDLAAITGDARLKNELHRQIAAYEDLQNRARAMLAVGGEEPKDQSFAAKTAAKLELKMKAMADRSPHNLAGMLVEGSELGVENMARAIRACPSANVGAVALAQRLQHAESEYAHRLQAFL